MSALLGAVGAGAGGYAQGKEMAQERQRGDRQLQLQELMGALQRRSMEREDEAAPPEFMQGLGASVPGFSGIPGGNRRENIAGAGLAQRAAPDQPGLSFEDRMAMIQERNKGAMATKTATPGRAGDPDMKTKTINSLYGMLQDAQSVSPDMLVELLKTDKRFEGMGANQAQIIASLRNRLKALGVDPDTGGDLAPSASISGGHTTPSAPVKKAALPAPPVAPAATAQGEEEWDYDANGKLVRVN